MKLTISTKLVGAFLVLTVLVLVATLGLARWSFERGFLDYVNALEQGRLERSVSRFAQIYSQGDNSWALMTPELFKSLLNGRDSSRNSRGRPPEGRGHPPEGRGHPPGRRPPTGKKGPGGPGGPKLNLLPPTALYDVSGQYVAGVQTIGNDAMAIRVPVLVGDETVGELWSEPRREISSPVATAFSRQQSNTSWVIGIVSLLLALMFSMFLARGLLSPIRRMMMGVSELSRGNYRHRMDETRADELGELTQNIDRLGETLESSQAARRRLLADVSHELRTPVTVLTGEIEAMKDGLRPFDQSQLESLEQEVQRLRFLIDDLYALSVSDVGGLTYQFNSIVLGKFVESAIVNAQRRAQTNDIALRIDIASEADHVQVSADDKRLDQLLQNLLDNALSYTEAPGQILISVSCDKHNARIVVEDSAPGISSGDYEKLFDPLYRGEASRSRRTGGAGLGLSICRNIVQAHQGTITASASSLGGVKMTIEIPSQGARNE